MPLSHTTVQGTKSERYQGLAQSHRASKLQSENLKTDLSDTKTHDLSTTHDASANSGSEESFLVHSVVLLIGLYM